MTTIIRTAACGIFLLACVAGCRQERADEGLDSDPPAAGAVREATETPQDNPATDPTTPTVEPTAPPTTTTPAPAPGTTAAPSPGTTTPAPAPGSTAPAPAPHANDAGTGRIPPPTSTGP